MAITRLDVEQMTFSPSRHGYDTEEVDNFLERLCEEIDGIQDEMALLRARVDEQDTQIVREAEQKAERIRKEADQKAREVIRQALSQKQAVLDEIERLRRENLGKTTQMNGEQGKVSEVSPNLASAISVVASIDRGILFDPALLPGFVADIAPDLEAEVRLVEIACMVGAIDALGGHGDKAARVREARDRLVSSFVAPSAVVPLIKAFVPFL